MTSPPAVTYQRLSPCAHSLQLTRPRALNALNLGMLSSMQNHLQKDVLGDARPTPSKPPALNSLLLLSGEGRAFCAGGDVKSVIQVATAKEDPATQNGESSLHKAMKFFREEYSLNHQLGTLLQNSNVAIVSLLDGITMGGGVGLSVHTPFRVATENTLFAMPETQIGLFPDVGGTFFLPRLMSPPALSSSQRQCSPFGMFLGLTGYRLKGSSAFYGGIATHYVPSTRKAELIEKLQSIGAKGHLDLNSVSKTLNDFCQLNDDWEFSGDQGMAKWALIERCFSAPSVEEIIKRLKKENGSTTKDFAEQCMKLLRKMSPLSLKITHRQLTVGAQLSFKQAFELEYRLVQHVLYALQHPETPESIWESVSSKVDDDSILYSHDFQTGVKSLLIDKPATEPRWTPSELELISDKTVDWYFRPLNLHKEDQDGVVFTNSTNYEEYPVQYGLPSRQSVFDAYVDLSSGCLQNASSACYNYQEQEYRRAKRVQTGQTPVKSSSIHQYIIGNNTNPEQHSNLVKKMVDWILDVDFVTVSGAGSDRMVIPK